MNQCPDCGGELESQRFDQQTLFGGKSQWLHLDRCWKCGYNRTERGTITVTTEITRGDGWTTKQD